MAETEQERRYRQEREAYFRSRGEKYANDGGVYASQETAAQEMQDEAERRRNPFYLGSTSPARRATTAIAATGINPHIEGLSSYRNAIEAMGSRPVANYFSPNSADMVRGQQANALSMLRAGLGQSAIGQQAGLQQGAMLQQGLNAQAGRGALGARQAMAASGSAATGLAGQAGNARLQEYLGQLSALEAGNSAMRGADLRTGQIEADNALAADRARDKQTIGALSMGSGLEAADRGVKTEEARNYLKLVRAGMTDDAKALDDYLQMVSSVGSTVLATAVK